ncbi:MULTISPECIES: hypothetical protein [Burkholderiaceae]|uniref:hypothetical protein n=1 Tax=Burkholderiaceae TaxID=119060 RepID=UPI000975484A|nr:MULTISPECIES: hypothetical protein [Burkholderiaceae]MCG1018410.1 hypothetical protein [Mycetohabitans sp. B4]
MGNFSRRLSVQGHDQWWLEIVGKGKRARIVPASPELTAELARYRQACGRPPLTDRTETTPLIMPFKDQRRCLSRSALQDAIKDIFSRTATWLCARLEFTDRADELDRASAHWLTHTTRSRQPTAASICARYATIWVRCRRPLRADTCFRKRTRSTVKASNTSVERMLGVE